jgi:hypothetical protein
MMSLTMSRTATQVLRLAGATAMLVLRVGGVVALVLGLLGASVALAQDAPAGDWAQTGLTAPVSRLYAPASGALLARTADGLMRSDDAGATWSAVSLPEAALPPATPATNPARIVVDPKSHATIYVGATDGLYKTDDDAATWKLILPTTPEAPWLQAAAVSPADTQVVYAALGNQQSRLLRIVRSPDGGATWETASERSLSPMVSCTWAVPLLQPHGTDPKRLFLAANCNRTGATANLEQSLDRGTTWVEVYKAKQAEPYWLIGGTADAPGLFLVGLQNDTRGGGYTVARSTDDAATWTTVAEHFGGGTATASGLNVTLGGLATDPTRVDRMLVALNQSEGPQRLASQLRLSSDGGASWADVAAPAVTRVSDVVFGIDGRMVFAATDTGVWRARSGG